MTDPSFDLFSLALPGATQYDAELVNRLAQARLSRLPGYLPRTRHLRPDGWAKYTNRLFLESSPYLLQHAHNPANWYPWGDEAFETAETLNRPVFLSVGYATCHWCHVMEEESFEDEEIAGFLNAHFVCVKVDREERPDIDAVYMSAVQALTGRGGWPMSVWLTPDRNPFYGGTYFPARDGDRGCLAGFLTLLARLREAYHTPDGRARTASLQIADHIRKLSASKPGGPLPDKKILDGAADFYRRQYDPVHGGMAGAPKFPSSLPIRFLIRYWRRTGAPDMLEMAENTLKHMAEGGMYDQAGGGFHRYSTDERWLVPHFEKMLYDNALLAVAFLEAHQATGDEKYKRMVEDILRYVERDMTGPAGEFYSATDADSRTPDGRMEEGYFFTWTPEELNAVLGEDRARIVTAYYGIGPAPDFEGRHILHVPQPGADTARMLGLSEDRLAAEIEMCRGLLYEARKSRLVPLRDEKILTAWNGIMISAFAKAGLGLGEPRFTETAVRAARFVLDHLVAGGGFYRSYKDGQARHNGYLEDGAFFTAALLDLYEATGDLSWFENALFLDDLLKRQYEDAENGGFFMTPSHHETLIVREKPCLDNAIPSGNSVAALNLLRLHAFTGNSDYRDRAERLFRAFAEPLARNPFAMADMLLAVDFYLGAVREIVLVTPAGNPEAALPWLSELGRVFVPNRVLAVVPEERTGAVSRLVPLVGEKIAANSLATAYVCEQGRCGLPTTDRAEFARQLALR